MPSKLALLTQPPFPVVAHFGSLLEPEIVLALDGQERTLTFHQLPEKADVIRGVLSMRAFHYSNGSSTPDPDHAGDVASRELADAFGRENFRDFAASRLLSQLEGRHMMSMTQQPLTEERRGVWREAIRLIESGEAVAPQEARGSIYTVAMALPEGKTVLDWDAPMKAQPEAAAKLQGVVKFRPSDTGREVYDRLARERHGERNADLRFRLNHPMRERQVFTCRQLENLGVVGICYLPSKAQVMVSPPSGSVKEWHAYAAIGCKTMGTHATEKGLLALVEPHLHRSYVIFEPQMVTLMGRNGQAIAAPSSAPANAYVLPVEPPAELRESPSISL